MEEEENVEGCWTGVLSIVAIARDVLGSTSPAAVIIRRASLGRAGPTEACWERSPDGKAL